MKTIVAFDFDGTLTKNDSFLLFIKFVKGRLFLYLHAFYFVFLWILFKINVLSRHQAKEIIFSTCFKNMPLDEFNKQCSLFLPELNKIIKKNVPAKIKKHIDLGHTPLIISASIPNWILPWAIENNIEQVIATEPEIDENKNLTGKFRTPNCHGIEKTNRLFSIYNQRNNFRLISYGDSSGDKELINNSDEGYWNYFDS